MRRKVPRSVHSREAVVAPALAAHPVMHEEEAVRIVFVLHGEQPRVVRSPERFTPRLVKEIAFRHIGADARQHLPDLVHRLLDHFYMTASGREIRLATWDVQLGWPSRCGPDHQRNTG